MNKCVYKYMNKLIKICIIEVFISKYYFESHLIYRWQTIFNQFNIMVPYVDVIVYAIMSQFYDK